MDTQELRRSESAGGVGVDAIVMAVGIVVDRISRIPEKDREDLYTLVKELRQAQTEEEVNAIRLAMVEILEQEPMRIVPAEMETIERNGKLNRWISFVSSKIRQIRKDKDMTQEQLAEKTGLPQSHISRLEAGQHSPSHVTLEKIAKGLDVKLSELDPSVA